ncbi:hypothetical protein LSCM1_05024 [Leishmania martiniquensis]|uniref:RRM domain-containing protein n=1 Tax=Leishmania martiniquensis TaxID=1580590 RepID=A0A836KLS4_9TRYP|nr:hypothetical protein LSCM1_05024 [Leishmania martiniquensis]
MTTATTLWSPNHAAVVTGLPAQGISTHDVRQFMTFCGAVKDVHLFPAAGTSPAATTSALVLFESSSSVPYAEVFGGGVFKGKAVFVRRATAAEVEALTVCSDSEPVAVEAAAMPPPPKQAPAGAQVPIPGAGNGAPAPSSLLQHVTQTVNDGRDRLWAQAREGMMQFAHSAATLELKAAEAVAEARSPQVPTSVYGSELAPQQYYYTPAQPQWGKPPTWQRTPKY